MFSRTPNTMSMVPKRFEASLMDHSKSKNLHMTQKMKNFKKSPNQPKQILGSSKHHLPHQGPFQVKKFAYDTKNEKFQRSQNQQKRAMAACKDYHRTHGTNCGYLLVLGISGYLLVVGISGYLLIGRIGGLD